MAGPLILVVDDEKDIVEIICDLFAGEGYRTCTAYDGQQALQAIAREKPDAVILDIKMPVLDGLEVIRRIRAEPSLASLPVVVLTATQVIQELQDRFRELHVTTWISKPFEPEDLLTAVKRALKKAS